MEIAIVAPYALISFLVVISLCNVFTLAYKVGYFHQHLKNKKNEFSDEEWANIERVAKIKHSWDINKKVK